MNKTSESELLKYTVEIKNSFENDFYKVARRLRKLYSAENDLDDDMLRYRQKILDEICPEQKRKPNSIDILEKARNNPDFACEILDMYHSVFIDLLCSYYMLKIEHKLEEYSKLTGLREKGVMEEFDQLRAEKRRRYQKRRDDNMLRKMHFNTYKRMGMTDADAYRKIIEIEEPNLKPGTAPHAAAMNRLKTWKSRTFPQKKHVTH